MSSVTMVAPAESKSMQQKWPLDDETDEATKRERREKQKTKKKERREKKEALLVL